MKNLDHIALQAAEQAQQAEPVAWDSIESVAAGRYKVVPSHESMFHRFAVVAGDGEQRLYLGRKVECENMAMKFSGAFLDGAFAYQQIIEPTQPPAVADTGCKFPLCQNEQYQKDLAEQLHRELCAGATAVAVPDGYVLTKIPHEYAKTLVNGGWNQYADGWNACRAAMLAAAPQGATLSAALADIAAERRRQIEQEGWTPEHDDEHRFGNMAFAAACYAIAGGNLASRVQSETVAAIWPWTGWAWSWWKPKDKRRNLVKAGALIAAEIERLDRAAQKGGA